MESLLGGQTGYIRIADFTSRLPYSGPRIWPTERDIGHNRYECCHSRGTCCRDWTKNKVDQRVLRALKSTLPYKLISGRDLEEAISFCVTWLNAFPKKQGCLKVFSSYTIMTNTTLDFISRNTVQFHLSATAKCFKRTPHQLQKKREQLPIWLFIKWWWLWSCSDLSSDELSDSTSSIRSDSPGRYPART